MDNTKQVDVEVYKAAENYTLNLIRSEHPEWVEPDGSCKRCEEYYMSLDSVIVIDS
jgi:hypothetical protein